MLGDIYPRGTLTLTYLPILKIVMLATHKET